MQLPLPLLGLPLDTVPSEVPRERRIYVNRNLRFDQVTTVGFDMDYTLAVYRQAEMDRLGIEATLQKMLARGYPEALLEAQVPSHFGARGLIIDRLRGNVLKMDRYRYVKKAYRGLRELDQRERHRLYRSKAVKVGTKRYHWVDTLYALCEVVVFATVVEFYDASGTAFDPGQVFDDIRQSIDQAHRDGTIVRAIRADPARYVQPDPQLPATLHRLRSGGKRLFLLTNSYADYTEAVMSFLFNDALKAYPTWRSYFDIIVTAAQKPRFFKESNIPFEAAEEGLMPPTTGFERGRIYQGGCLRKFRELASASGDQVLYVGDHIYGDVLRAKKDSAWRTAMIIQEMDVELRAHEMMIPLLERLDEREILRDLLVQELRTRKDEVRRLDKEVAVARTAAEPTREPAALRLHHRKAIKRIQSRVDDLEGEIRELEDRIDSNFHSFWGSLFKAGPEVSLFGDQVEQYACLYMDRVSNLQHYSPVHYFRSPRDRMPHE